MLRTLKQERAFQSSKSQFHLLPQIASPISPRGGHGRIGDTPGRGGMPGGSTLSIRSESPLSFRGSTGLTVHGMGEGQDMLTRKDGAVVLSPRSRGHKLPAIAGT